jgi:glycerol-3-phosphate dehydrogenase (NAD(P)+)
MADTVAVLGEGSMGTTLAATVASRERQCVLWCRSADVATAIRERRSHPRQFPTHELPPALSATADIERAVGGASLVIVAVPSPLVRATAQTLARVFEPRQMVLSATKGIESSTLKRMSEVLAEELGTDAVGTISGPNVTPDIMAGHLTAVVVASRDAAVIAAGARALSTPRFKVYGNPDLAGVEAAGVLKNAIAIAMGLATGLGWPANTRSFLLTRGLAEIRQVGLALGAEPATFYGLAGIGDLFLTSTSPDSLNYRVGVELGRGRALEEIVAGMPEQPEGINSTRGCCALAARAGLAVPIAARTLQIIEGQASPASLEEALVGPDPYSVDRDAFH